MGRVGGAELRASRATANARSSSEARERGAWPRQARAPDITRRYALHDALSAQELRRIMAGVMLTGRCAVTTCTGLR